MNDNEPVSSDNAASPVDSRGKPAGRVYFIGAGPGDPDLITVRGRALIERCRVCLFAGSLVPRAVVEFAPAGAEVRNTASMNLEEIVARMAAASTAGEDVARVHSGDPSLYGAVAEQMRRLDALGIDYEVVPGVSSFQAAAAALKFEWTPAGRCQTVILTRAAGRTGLPPGESLASLAAHRTALAIFLSAAQMDAVVAALAPHYGADAPVVVAYRVSWPDEVILRCTLAEAPSRMSESKITRTALVIVGPMLDDTLPDAESHLYNREYSHLFRKARRGEPD